MKDDTMQKAVDEFILQRINSYGRQKNAALQEAYAELGNCITKLKDTFSNEQNALFNECENAFCLIEGEIRQNYYRAGFSDAVIFLLGWRDKDWT